ncbi:LysR family transcriptional regulator [Pontibacillus salicampi]|uniref:LysR family transcriptional regulator n=1 Tax=Pontibacillus salicampi TaxID=1449801 RepID=A0ABV6LQI8_9BACI
MKLDDYRLLHTLQKEGTIRAAARAQYVSQPAVTQRLHYIESYFNTKIFIRTSKQLLLTSTGEKILQHAADVLRKEEEIHQTIAQANGEVAGTLRIGASTLVSQRFLPESLERFTTLYPNVTIDLVTGISADIKQSNEPFHIRLVRGDKMVDKVHDYLFSDELLLFDTKPFQDHHVKERPLIEFKSDPDFTSQVEEWFYHHPALIPQKTIKVDQFETCKQFMKRGLGMAVLPKSVSLPELQDLPHLPLIRSGKPVVRDTWACYVEEAKQLPQVAAFLQILHEMTFA